MPNHHSPRLTANEQGFVSIVVTVVVMSILGLIVVGFMAVMTREQRQVLDRQLSTQAYYAAEAGVNDAIAYLHTGGASQSTCGPVPGYDNQLDGSNNVSYSCVLIDKSPLYLTLDAAVGRSAIVPLKASGQIQDIVVSWQDSGSGAVPSPSTFISDPTHKHALPANADPSIGTGILRTSVMPFNPGNGRDQLIDQSSTFFLYPNDDNGGTNNVQYNQDGAFIDGNCDTAATRPRFCQAVITNLPGKVATNTAYLRFKALYKSVSVHIQARDAAGNPLALSDAQAIVDSTGKASDVLRRIQVSVPLVNSYNIPEAALNSLETICKRMVVWNGGVFADPPTGDPLFPASETDSCNVPSVHTGVSGTIVCGPPVCNGPPATQKKYYWGFTRINNTDAKGLTITGCLWDFGDGNTEINKWCTPGSVVKHTYDPPPDLGPYPAACYAVGVGGRRQYTVRLTTTYSNGTSDSVIALKPITPWCLTPP